MIALFKHLKPYNKAILLILILTLAGILLELYLPTLMADVVDIGIVNNDISFILKTGGWMIFYSILAVILTIAVMYYSSKVALGFGKDVRHKLFVHVENF